METPHYNKSDSSNQKKRNRFKFSIVFTMLSIFVLSLTQSIQLTEPIDKEPTITHLGKPNEPYYLYFNAYNPWDMIVVDGSLYVGGGDYGENTGPTTIQRYDIEEDKWSSSAFVEDEAVSKFILIDNSVFAPGIDPTIENWDFGNYHRLVGQTWETVDTLPDAVHNYDIITFEGITFFAIGTSTDDVSPVKMTADHEIYTDVPFYFNGADISSCENYDFFRVYDFYIAKGELYCLFSAIGDFDLFAFCKYNDGKFELLSSTLNNELNYCGFWQDRFGPSATLDGTCYFTTGYLYKTNDFHEIERINTPDNGSVTDMLIEKSGLFQNDKMYILSTVETESGEYKSTIWEYENDGKFEEVYSFSTETSALSFAKYKTTFFVGLGGNNNTSDAAGSILKIN